MSTTANPKDGPDLSDLLNNNRDWATRIKQQDADFFQRLANEQKPKYLWIGCSDSRVPVNQITNMAPGEVFVHRNVANIVHLDDANCQSAVEFAVAALEVEHVIVCGHYNCGGVKAAMQGDAKGTVARWINSIVKLHQREEKRLKSLSQSEALATLCEMNVELQLTNLAKSAPIQQAWNKGRKLSLHGWIYSLEDGLLRDLGLSMHGNEHLP